MRVFVKGAALRLAELAARLARSNKMIRITPRMHVLATVEVVDSARASTAGAVVQGQARR
jgi:hypothetical protein